MSEPLTNGGRRHDRSSSSPKNLNPNLISSPLSRPHVQVVCSGASDFVAPSGAWNDDYQIERFSGPCCKKHFCNRSVLFGVGGMLGHAARVRRYKMASGPREKDHAIRLSTELFLRIELVVYVALGIVLSATALLVLGSAALLLWEAISDWSGTKAIFLIVDRLMFVLMLIEILHTVRGSVRSGALTPEPFLIVGLIASIRNVLVITLKSSGVTSEGQGSIGAEMLFRSSIVELGVLGGLILIFVVSIYLLWRGRAQTAANAAQADHDRPPRAADVLV